MLWYKGWLETRWRFAFSLGVMFFFVVFFYWAGSKGPPPKRIDEVLGGAVACVMWVVTMLAGAGINTQPSFQATKGLHGSVYFTLSLPVRRFRLLLVRSVLGWLLLVCVIAAFCWGFWAVFPPVRAVATGMEMVEYAAALIAYGSAFYSTSVLLGTFLDDQWRVFGSVISFSGLWAFCNMSPMPRSVNIFQAVLGNSPLAAHAMPWASVGVAAGMTLILFWAASRIVSAREY